MLELGCLDTSVNDADCLAYEEKVRRLTFLSLAEVKPGLDRFERRRPAAAAGAMSVGDVQQALRDAGFLPGGQVDGIYGYRTLSAVRLFQEYVRTHEAPESVPDGQCGPKTQAHLRRWREQRLVVPAWAPAINAWQSRTTPPGEYAQWLHWLAAVQQRHAAAPSPVLAKVAAHAAPSATRPVARWDYTDTTNIHLVGISRQQYGGRFDDIYVLLIKGLVFKFQGSTEPGAATNPAVGPPYLVPGQHDYRFGWHQRSYLALRPAGNGVLMARAPLGAAPGQRWQAPLQPAVDINIHWGGLGLDRNVNSWSEGCQVITGGLYLDPADRLVDCTGFAAVGSKEPLGSVGRTRGAYNVLLDLVAALGSDIAGTMAVKYTLLPQEDLALAPDLARSLDSARERAMARVGG